APRAVKLRAMVPEHDVTPGERRYGPGAPRVAWLWGHTGRHHERARRPISGPAPVSFLGRCGSAGCEPCAPPSPPAAGVLGAAAADISPYWRAGRRAC